MSTLENQTRENPSKSDLPIGFKKSETISPSEALGAFDGQLPEGMRFYIRQQMKEIAKARNVTIGLYRVERPPGAQKERRVFVAEFPDVPTDGQIQSLCPMGGTFRWYGKGYAVNNDPCEWQSEEILIEPKIDGGSFASQRSQPLPERQIDSPSSEDVEERYFVRFERMLSLVKSVQGPSPLESVQLAIERVSNIMENQMTRQLEGMMTLQEKIRARASKDVVKALDGGESMPAAAQGLEDVIPGWLQPFMPRVEELFHKLTGGGIVGNVAAKVALSNSDVVGFFQDEEKLVVLAEILTKKFGEEKAEKAFDLLYTTMEKMNPQHSAHEAPAAAPVKDAVE